MTPEICFGYARSYLSIALSILTNPVHGAEHALEFSKENIAKALEWLSEADVAGH